MPSPDGKPGQQSEQYKLIGKDYTTPDLYAKVTGKAKYAEDFRAEGMLFCKLLLSPVPHGRVKHLDLSKALAMPGVKAILTQDDLPAPADSVTDLGAVIKANKQGEKALTMEPLYQGEPILAVAAVDELTAAEAIEKIDIEFEHSAVSWSIRSTACGPEGPTRARKAISGSEHRCHPPSRGRSRQARLRRMWENSNGRLQISPRPRKAACPWAKRPTSGPTAMWTLVSRMLHWFWMKLLSHRIPAIRPWSLVRHWLIGRTARCSFTWGPRARCKRWPAWDAG